MSLETCFTRSWYRSRGWTWSLAPLLLLTHAYAQRKRRRYLTYRRQDSYQSKLPLVVVGNISVGGTGKSPMVLALVECLQAHGFKPGIVTRGHKRKGQQAVLVNAQSSAAEVGDEPLMLARRGGCPVAVSAKRVEAVKLLEQLERVDIIISDDGLQHYAMDRDIEIAMIDATRALGNQQMLPVGPLREPPERLDQVDYAFAIGDHFPIQLRTSSYCAQLRLGDLMKVQDAKQSMPITALSEGEWSIVTGIGNPERFINSLSLYGLPSETARYLFPDHHNFTKADMPDATSVVMTEKDAVKVEAFAKSSDDWWYVTAKLELPVNFTSSFMHKLNIIVQQKTLTHE